MAGDIIRYSISSPTRLISMQLFVNGTEVPVDSLLEGSSTYWRFVQTVRDRSTGPVSLEIAFLEDGKQTSERFPVAITEGISVVIGSPILA